MTQDLSPRDRGPRPSAHILRAICDGAWALQEEKLEAILHVLDRRAMGMESLSEAEVHALARPAPAPVAMPGHGIAVMSLYGVVAQRMNLVTNASGGTSTDVFGLNFDKLAADPSVRAIVIDVDSPGGSVNGTAELAQKILQARVTKPVFAIANSLAASAAYWIMSAATELWATPTAEVGSIGVYVVHEDISQAAADAGVKYTLIKAGRYKTEGNPYEPLAASARDNMQQRVDEYYGMFTQAVATQRGVGVDRVRSGFGEGRVVSATDARRMGMIDRIGTLDAIVHRAASTLGNYASAQARGDFDAAVAALEDERAARRRSHLPSHTALARSQALLEEELANDGY